MSELPAYPHAPTLFATAPRHESPWTALYTLMLRTQLTRARVWSLALLGLLGVIVAFVVGNATAASASLDAGTEIMNEFGLWLLVPVPTLVFASSALGDLVEDKTLVYLWLRPVDRWRIVTSAAAASMSISWPLVVPALTAGAVLTNGGQELVAGTALAATVVMAAYVGLFVLLGLLTRRPLAWGLLYIFIWEGFIARGSGAAAKLALRAYGSSILRYFTGIELLTSEIDYVWALVIPPVVAVATLAFATRRLSRGDVD